MKVYTKKGDKGQTSLYGGARVDKDSTRLEAYGTVDELNAYLGLLRSKIPTKEGQDDKDFIYKIQQKLSNLEAILATDETHIHLVESCRFYENDSKELEDRIDEMTEILPKLNAFIVYGDDELSSISHVCRAIARRSERRMVSVNKESPLDPMCIMYMNRLSDFLFTFARYLTKKYA